MSDKDRRAWRRIKLWALVALTAFVLGLLPAASSVRRSSRLAQSKAELTRLESGLLSFKARFGCLPPGHIELAEHADGWNADSRRAIRRIWPQYDFDQKVDLNADGDTDDVHALSGGECLVFFLGGVQVSGVLCGLNKDPRHPFAVDEANATNTDAFYEFDSERFSDVDRDGAYEYVGSLPDQVTPILYSGPLSHGTFDPRVLDVFASGSSHNLRSLYSDSTGELWKRSSFQLIDPGADNEYGIGGLYDPDGEEWWINGREAERDNVTNFNEGTRLGGTLPLSPIARIQAICQWLLVFFAAVCGLALIAGHLGRDKR